MTEPVRIAMWSGPRNLSTALLRSWGNRPDTTVTDEPLYAHYLHTTGIDHPARNEVLATYDHDWRRVTAWLTGPVPGGHAIWYQKHMTHHITDDIDLGWLGGLRHCFLIRSPAEVIASYARVRHEPTLNDLGLPQQWRLFAHVTDSGALAPVIDAADLLRDPRAALSALCDTLGVAFSERMLSWPPGRRETDGVWADHWYEAVERSTGFAPYEPRQAILDARFDDLLAAAEDIHGRLAAHRLVTV
jgi:Sulfotransferase domain